MSALRVKSGRVVVCLVAGSLVISILVFNSLHTSQQNNLQFLKFTPRSVFPDPVPPKRPPVFVKTEKEFSNLIWSAGSDDKSRDTEIPGHLSLGRDSVGVHHTNASPSLIYRSQKEASRNDNLKRWQIPKIIHQTWATPQVPTSLSPFIKSFIDQNPDYEYWFWSDQDGLNLMKTRFRQYLDIYTQYAQPIHRADAIRYFILYEFGGFYADADMAALKSFEPLRRHSCIVSQEPWVHAKVYWHWDHLMPCNAFMASAPKHPFMKKLVDHIPQNFHGSPKDEVMNKTGPMMLERILKEYEKEKEGHDDFDRLYLAEPNLFHPRYDPNLRGRYIQGCENPVKYHLSKEEVQECAEARRRRYAFKLPPEAYTDHHWMHYWIGGQFVRKINPSRNVHVNQIIPSVKNVTRTVLDAPSQ